MANVLIVEDEALLALALIDDLAGRGHTVFDANDGLFAIDMLREFSPDVLVTDLMMPRLGGADLIRHVRAQPGRRLPIILVTAVAEAKLPPDLSHDAYLSKPLDHEALGAIVARLAAAQ